MNIHADSWPRWLKLKHAAAYSAIGKQRLVALAQAGQVRGFQDPDSGRREWIFDRCSIDAYRESQAPAFTVEDKALEIMSTL